MRLYDYFESKIEYNFLNKYYIHDKMLSYNELIDFLDKNADKELVKDSEFALINAYRLNNFLDQIKNIKNTNPDDRNYIFIKSIIDTNDYSVHESAMMYYDGNLIKKAFNVNSHDNKGIVILRDKIVKAPFKRYENFDDLLKNEDVAIFIEDKNRELLKVVCYNIKDFEHFIEGGDDFIIPILFGGSITDEDSFTKIPPSKNGSIVQTTYARPDVKGRNLLYPTLAYFANNNILMADRNMISKFARSVWSDFFKGGSQFLKKHNPIDNMNLPITLKDTSDDGRLFLGNSSENIKLLRTDIGYNKEIIEKMSKLEQKKKLIRTRQVDPVNWTYKLKKGESEISNVIKIMKERHLNNKSKITGLENQLIKLHSLYESKRIF